MPSKQTATHTDQGVSRFLALRNDRGKSIAIHVVEFLSDSETSPLAFVLPFTSAHSRQMRPFADALSRRGLHAVAVDLPGHGRSGGRRGVFRLPCLFAIFEGLIDVYRARFPHARLAMVGSSWGGDLTMLYAMWEAWLATRERRTPQVDAVVAHAVITPWQRDIFSKFRIGISLLFRSGGFGKKVLRGTLGPRLAVERMFHTADLYERKDLQMRFVADPMVLTSYDTDSYLDYLTYVPPARFSEVRTPVLVVHGDRDKLVPLEYEERVVAGLRAANPNVAFRVLAGAGHGVFEEAPELAAETASDWLSEQWFHASDAQPLREIVDRPAAASPASTRR